jgi:hypothetical protein
MNGNFYSMSQGTSKTPRELVGLNEWRDSTCSESPGSISTQAELTPEEIKKVNEICKGTKIIISDMETKRSSKGGFNYYTPILCQKTPTLVTISELTDYKSLELPSLKNCKNCEGWEAAGTSGVKPELKDILSQINSLDSED